MKTVIHMIITLSLIGIISGAALSEISKWAEPKIAAHRKAETEKAIFLVQRNARKQEKVENVGIELYRVYDSAGNQIGYAMPYEGSGFQGKIRIMFGVTSDLNRIVGLEILEQVETPGLGTKIAEDPFRNQFDDLNAEPEIKWVKGAPPSKSNEIQTITGATISSKAIVAIVNAGLESLRRVKESGGVL